MPKYPTANAIAYYDRLCRRFGASVEAVAWRSRFSQRQRFLALSLLLPDWDGLSVLDVGCGQGDFLGFLKAEGYKVRYTGLDFSAEMCRIAGRLYPEAVFECQDLLQWGCESIFDVVVASGTFNIVPTDRPYTYLNEVMTAMWARSRQLMGLCLLSTAAKEAKAGGRFVYYEPLKVLDRSLAFSDRIDFKSHYLDNDFCVGVYR